MQVIFFTKFLKGLSPEEIGAVAKKLKFDGLDLAIRQGQCVNPANVKEALPKAMATWKQMGLSVPMVTLETSWVDPKKPELQAVYEACGEAGIPYIKLGYWSWKPGQRYWAGVKAIREDLSKFRELGEKHKICSLVHTHSHACYGSNASGAMHLVRGFDPRYVGIYLDPAHLAVGGEYLPMALDMVRDHLKMIGVKNARHVLATGAEGPRWKVEWCPLSEGLVYWSEALRLLKDLGYDGPLSVHGEYSASEQTSEVLKLVGQDMDYLKPYLA